MHEQGDTFGGYKLRQIEELLWRVVRQVDRIGKKIDVLTSGMTPEEVTAAVAQLEADAKQVDDATSKLVDVATKLGSTGVT